MLLFFISITDFQLSNKNEFIDRLGDDFTNVRFTYLFYSFYVCYNPKTGYRYLLINIISIYDRNFLLKC